MNGSKMQALLKIIQALLKPTLKASALLLTIVIALLVALICSSLLLLAYHDLQVDRITGTNNRLRRNFLSAVNIVLADTSRILISKADTIDLFAAGEDTALIERENWGLFDVAAIAVRAHGQEKSKCFFFGPAAQEPLDACLYLADHHIPLNISGFGQLTGDAYLPKGGVHPAYIDQRGFSSAEPLTGNIRASQDSLPPIDTRLVDLLSQLLGDPAQKPGGAARERRNPSQSLIPDTLDCSFADTATVIHRTSPITLNNYILKGHIRIVSDSSITVDSGCQLENVILAAPFIELKSGFSGTIQVFARDSIIIRNNCHLHYPSGLLLVKAQGSADQPVIRLGDSCTLEGILLTLTGAANDQTKTYVEIGNNSTITGYIYTSGFLFLKGTVHGTVLADYLLYKSSFSIYQNYLVDAVIDRKQLSGYFAGPKLFNDTGRINRIIQWVK
jgi:hypothetical protein